jgi:hypothetical protein
MILHLIGFCPKTAIILDRSGYIYIPQFLAVFCNVYTPLCHLSSESAIMTWSSAKRKLFIFAQADNVMPFV